VRDAISLEMGAQMDDSPLKRKKKALVSDALKRSFVDFL
jgi:hypothetical protein